MSSGIRPLSGGWASAVVLEEPSFLATAPGAAAALVRSDDVGNFSVASISAKGRGHLSLHVRDRALGLRAA